MIRPANVSMFSKSDVTHRLDLAGLLEIKVFESFSFLFRACCLSQKFFILTFRFFGLYVLPHFTSLPMVLFVLYLSVNSCSGDQNPRKAIQWLTHDQKVSMVRTVFLR